MRILVAMFQGGGNIPLILPIVASLAGRGHQVRVLAGPGIRPAAMSISAGFLQGIQAAGAAYVPFREPEEAPYTGSPPLQGVIGRWLPRRLQRIAAGEARTTVWSGSWAENVTEELSRTPADIVVADYWLLGAIAAAEAARVPCGVLVHNAFPPRAAGHPPKGFGFIPSRNPLNRARAAFWTWARERVWNRNGLPAHNQARATLGLPPLGSPFEEYERAALVLVLGSEAFDFPTKALPPNVRYVGTPVDDAGLPSETWMPPWPTTDNRPLVLVSLSTLSQGQAPVLRRILEAIGQMDVRAIVTLGPALNREDFSAPANAAVESFVPHSAVLPHVSAMITQCGLGSLTKALLHGIPLLCFPLVGDQPDNAARIVSRGAGLRLSPESSAQQIKLALARILTEPRFRQAAQSLGRRMSVQRAEDIAAAELEALLAKFENLRGSEVTC